MASILPAVRGDEFPFPISLVSQADTDIFQTSVTLAVGDVTVSLDGGGVNNITNLPVEIGTTGILTVTMTGAQMTADYIVVRFHDVAGAEWQDALVIIYTGAQTFDTIGGQVDDIGVAGAGLTALGDARLDNLDAAISSRGTADPGDAMDLIADPVNIGVAGAGLTALGDARLANLDATVSSRAIPGDEMALTAAALLAAADAIWDELLAGHAIVGSTGAALTASGAAGDPWASLLPGAYVDGSAGNIIGNIVSDVWTRASRTTTSNSTAPGTGLTAQVYTVIRGDTETRTFADIAADGSITKCQFNIKESVNDSEDDAVLAVDSTTGLIRLNAAAPAVTFTASFVVATGILTITAATMSQLEPTRFLYDVQVWRGVAVETIESGTLVVTGDITRTY